MNDAIREAVKARQPAYPPEQSMSGINSYNFGCRVAGYSPGYCVCLNKIAAYERDGDLTSYPDCGKGIRNGDCPALAMRTEERTAGQAIYFIDRALLREEMNKQFAENAPSFRTTKSITTTKPTRAAPTTLKGTTDGIYPSKTSVFEPEDGYAAAINAAIAATPPAAAPAAVAAEPEETTKVAVPSPSTVKRPSLIEMAQMTMGKPKQE